MAEQLLVLALATYRISRLFALEEGPWDIFHRVRRRAGAYYDEYSVLVGSTTLSKGLVCMDCNSIWFGTLWALFWVIAPTVSVIAALPFALSTVVLFLRVIKEVIHGSS